ncbi:MAG: hypothetical protein QF473_30225 [Planctomycetota bacterium]|nr:hypothetical protein [Planctomycetota bacterium]
MTEISSHFPEYSEYDPSVPVWCVTPGTGRIIHRFFDTSPFSPSGRYLALTRLPYEDRLPDPGDAPAQVVVVDLENGKEEIVGETFGWDTQLGAQAQWGCDDSQLFFNDLDTQTWRPFAVLLDISTGFRKELEGTVYMASSDGRHLASPCLRRTGLTQAGYGVIVPEDHVPLNTGAATDDGLFVTDTMSGKCHLLVSLAEIVDVIGKPLTDDDFEPGAFYGFHVKWNRTGDRLMFVLRWLPHDPGEKQRFFVITMMADGSDIKCAIPWSEWSKGGHHPDWAPDGVTVTMNLNINGEGMRFISARYDGANLKLLEPNIRGSGHPTLHPNGRTIVTDAYPKEPVACGDGTVPIRVIDIENGTEINAVRMQTVPTYAGPKGELRVDPHPAWDSNFRRIAFNGFSGGTRRVYVADLSELRRGLHG